MSKFAKISFNGRFICNFPEEKLRLINKDLIKKYYTDTLTNMIQEKVVVCFNEILSRASNSVKPGGQETRLIDALKESIEYRNQIYANDRIGILSFDVLDRLLEIKTGKLANRRIGWWRVFESKQDTIVNNDYMFIGKSGYGKFREGFLIHREDLNNKNNFKPFKYSIRDKRYVTKFILDITKETVDNEVFMDNVMFIAISKMFYDLNLYSGQNPNGD